MIADHFPVSSDQWNKLRLAARFVPSVSASLPFHSVVFCVSPISFLPLHASLFLFWSTLFSYIHHISSFDLFPDLILLNWSECFSWQLSIFSPTPLIHLTGGSASDRSWLKSSTYSGWLGGTAVLTGQSAYLLTDQPLEPSAQKTVKVKQTFFLQWEHLCRFPSNSHKDCRNTIALKPLPCC